MRQGCFQLYTGDGKGKTTAAIGLAVRAAGAGMRVFIVQFLKASDCSELAGLARFGEDVTVQQFGAPGFVRGTPSEADVAEARRGLTVASEVLAKGEYGLVILDEAALACAFELLRVEEVLDAVRNRAPGVEAVVTGRQSPEELIAAADLVTEMRAVKHYYSKGLEARTGIEK